MIKLKGRSIEKLIPSEGTAGLTLLDLALKEKLDWGFSCSRGTCARCRCYIESGRELLNEYTDAELDRLDEEELEQGFRLGCQAKMMKSGELTAYHKTYF